jgi:hypothetical protein
MLYEPIIRGFRKACPKCAEGRLQWRNWKHWQNISQEGRRSCDHLVYYQCDRCQCKLKIFRGGLTRDVYEEEWARHCEGRGCWVQDTEIHGKSWFLQNASNSKKSNSNSNREDQ